MGILTKALLVLTAVITIWTDGRCRKIYNKILAPVLGLALILNLWGGGWHGLLLSVIGALIGFLLLYIPYQLGGMGAGDVKLLAVFGALSGPKFILNAFLYGALLGGGFALYYLLKKEKNFAYGIPLSLGAVLATVLPWGLLK